MYLLWALIVFLVDGMESSPDAPMLDIYRITLVKEQAAFMLRGVPRTTADGVAVMGTYQTTVKRAAEYVISTVEKEQGAVGYALGHLEKFRVQTAEYYGMPDDRVRLLHEIDSLGDHSWEMIYTTTEKELETGEVLKDEEAVYDHGVVICCGTVSIKPFSEQDGTKE